MEVEIKDAEVLYDKVGELLAGVNLRLATVALHMILGDILDADAPGFERNGVTTKMRQTISGNWVTVRTDVTIDRYN